VIGNASSPDLPIAAFVSPHGFGHAARSSAVMLAAMEQGGARFDVFTTAPRWFFEESLGGAFRYHEEVVDVGFRQRSALHVDVDATVAALRDFLPLHEERVSALAAKVRAMGCRAVLSDIAPLGIAVAERAGLPSVLVENFSWPWLYEPYAAHRPELKAFGDELARWTARASVHVQARPMCEPNPALEAVDPIGRPPRDGRKEVRGTLGVPEGVPLVVVTMGGYEEDLSFLPRLEAVSDTHFLVTGAHRTERQGRVHLYDNRTPLYMPDVLRAADAVVAKLGYGMVAEVWAEGLPFAQVTRPGFREMAALEAFADEQLAGFRLSDGDFAAGAWIDRLPELLATDRRPHEGGGAGRVSEILLEVATA
jgi:hypothetical protein